MKKKDISIKFLSNHLYLFQCPVCEGNFKKIKGNQLLCENNHTFDISKKGTIHFLLGQANNQYNKDIFISRTRIAHTGFWNLILDEIIKRLNKTEGNHLDVGCGEGSHLNYLSKNGLTGNKIGFDISKEGIQLAAAQYTDVFWCVADLTESPFSENQFDTIFNIFSPSNYKEFQRLLKTGGQVIKVVPNTNYLKEVRRALYGRKKEYSNERVIENFLEHYPDSFQIPISYKYQLDHNQIQDFLKMTPLVWNAEENKINELLNRESLFVTVDVILLIGEK